MSMGELLGIEPLELKFPFELKKQISYPKKYCVRPNAGIVLPRSTCDVIGAHSSVRRQGMLSRSAN
ncbi:hypothetical protein OIU76_018219 [Salix suchowensis]|nr:hypothetical protein OIU76_018219 [Salix suchowensis]